MWWVYNFIIWWPKFLIYTLTHRVPSQSNKNYVNLINDDYFDILECNPKIPSRYEKDPVEWLFNRFDVASVKTGHFPARFFNL